MKKIFILSVAFALLSYVSICFAGDANTAAAKSSVSTTYNTDIMGNQIIHHDINHTPEESYKEGISRGRYKQYCNYSELFSNLTINDGLIDEMIAYPETSMAKKINAAGNIQNKSSSNNKMIFVENDHHYDEKSLNKGIKDGMAEYEHELLHDTENGSLLTIEQHFNMGLTYINSKNFENALLHFNVIVKNGGESNPYYYKAIWYNAYSNMNIKYNERIALKVLITYFNHFDKEIKADSIFYAGKLLVDISWNNENMSKKYYEKAVLLLSSWTNKYEKNKNYLEALLKLATAQEKIKEYGAAYNTYKKIVRLFPNSTIAKEAEKRMEYLAVYFPY